MCRWRNRQTHPPQKRLPERDVGSIPTRRTICESSTTASIPAFQAGDGGSTPLFRSKHNFKRVIPLTDVEFVGKVKKAVADYANEHLDATDNKKITTEDVYIVWYCKTLQNWKVLASTTLPDGMYYELTVNGDKNEMYLDAYKKFENRRLAI